MIDRIPESSIMSAAEMSARYDIRFTEGRANQAVATTIGGTDIKVAALQDMTLTIPNIPKGTPQDFIPTKRKLGPLEASGVQPKEQSFVLSPLTGTKVDKKA